MLPAPPLSWRAWDHEIVVYNDVSGDTHLLDPLASEAFEALCEAPASLTELTDRVASSVGVDRTAELDDAVASIIRRFRSFGLIEPVQR